jgi:predicted aconitase with swiveling domain
VAEVTSARSLVPGDATGIALVLTEPLSLWGGMDAATGVVTDPHHPQSGAVVVGRVLVMPSGRGSSSSPSVLAEAIRAGTGPVAIVLGEADALVALGAIVAAELYGVVVPVVVADAASYRRIADGTTLSVRARENRAVIETS